MKNIKRNAIILAAGTASRFVPLSAECPKGLLEVKGEILIERQIRQLQEAEISDITIVVGYKAEMFEYLKDKFGVAVVLNEDYNRYNNTSSIIRVLNKLGNTYICSSDNYFPENVFVEEPTQSYYSALYAEGMTSEYCLTIDSEDNITGVAVGGHGAWYMVGHVYFSENFSQTFKQLLVAEYEKEETKQGYWEDVYIHHINELPLMKIHYYKEHDIEEFDSIDELRQFDESYINDTRSTIIKQIAKEFCCNEGRLYGFRKTSKDGFTFIKDPDRFIYENNKIARC